MVFWLIDAKEMWLCSDTILQILDLKTAFRYHIILKIIRMQLKFLSCFLNFGN